MSLDIARKAGNQGLFDTGSFQTDSPSAGTSGNQFNALLIGLMTKSEKTAPAKHLPQTKTLAVPEHKFVPVKARSKPSSFETAKAAMKADRVRENAESRGKATANSHREAAFERSRSAKERYAAEMKQDTRTSETAAQEKASQEPTEQKPAFAVSDAKTAQSEKPSAGNEDPKTSPDELKTTATEALSAPKQETEVPKEVLEKILELLRKSPEVGNEWKALPEDAALRQINDLLAPLLPAIQMSGGLQNSGGAPSEKALSQLWESLRENGKLPTRLNVIDDQTALKILKKVMDAKSESGAASFQEALVTAQEDSEEKEQPHVVEQEAGAEEASGSEKKAGAKKTRSVETFDSLNLEEGKSDEILTASKKEAAAQANGKGHGNTEEVPLILEEATTGSSSSSPTTATAQNPVIASTATSGTERTNTANSGNLADSGKSRIPEKNPAGEPLNVGKGQKGFHAGNEQNSFSSGSDRQMTGARTENTATTKNASEPLRATIFSQLVEKASLMKGPEQSKVLTIELKPEFLGRVEMELTSKNGAVSARILADNPMVRDTIESLIPQIREHLAEQGINLQQFSVDVSSQQSRGDPSSQNSHLKKNSRGLSAQDARIGDQDPTDLDHGNEKSLTSGNGLIDITV